MAAESATKIMPSETRGKSPRPGATHERPSSPANSTSSREGEKDTRERLKKTSIAGLSQKAESQIREANGHITADVTENGSARGRIPKKRSFEGVNKDETETDSTVEKAAEVTSHKRMRSRDIKNGEEIEPLSSSLVLEMSDTGQEEADPAVLDTPGGAALIVEKPSQDELNGGERPQQKSENVTSNIEPPAHLPSGPVGLSEDLSKASSFGNISTASPFGGTKSPPPDASTSTTSSAAFASSGLSAFASSTTSPFSNSSPAKNTGFSGSHSAQGFSSLSKGFGGLSSDTFGGGNSAFGTTPKPFGSSAVFGTPKAFGSSLGGGFGGGAAPGAFGAAKPFGSSLQRREEDEDDTRDDPEAEQPILDENTTQDDRFHEQSIDTGEEGEETIFSCRAKLYFLERGVGWKERGVGLLKVNVREVDPPVENESQPGEDVRGGVQQSGDPSRTVKKARLVMRADGVHRVILNTPVFKGMRFGTPENTEPSGKTMHLQSMENGEMRGLQVKIGKEEILKDLYYHIHVLEQAA